MKNRYFMAAVTSVLTFVFAFSIFASTTVKTAGGTLKYTDVHSQTAEFIGYNKSIVLTKQQERIKLEVLSSIPASCCSSYSMATCCCPCNLAKSVWGLSNYLVAKKNYDAPRLKQAVLEWMKFTNKNGYSGDACFQDNCNQPFQQNGCGGMNETRISF